MPGLTVRTRGPKIGQIAQGITVATRKHQIELYNHLSGNMIKHFLDKLEMSKCPKDCLETNVLRSLHLDTENSEKVAESLPLTLHMTLGQQ